MTDTQCQPEADGLRQHTPTPWRVHGLYPEEIYATVDGNRFMVAEVCGAGDTSQDKANAAFIVEAVNNYATLRSRVEELTKALEWQPVGAYPNDNSIVLVANPDEGTLPVIGWKVEDTWYHQDWREKKPLDPQPTIWMAWPKMPRGSMVSLDKSGGAT